MNDDFLSQLSSALAEEKQGATAVPAVTRERIMTSLAQATPRRRLRLAWGMPLLLGLVGSSAWASQQEGVWAWLGEQLGPKTDTVAAASGSGTRPAAASSAGSPRASSPQAPEQQAVEAQPAVAQPADSRSGPLPQDGSAAPVPAPVAGASAMSAPSAKTPASAQPASASAPSPAPATLAAEPPPAAEVAEDGGLALYRAAHDAQFRSASYATALDGYQAYLRKYAAGAFVPEARYNSALCLLNLGREDEARELLQPFAAGAYGGYRSQRARELLEAIESR